LINCFYKTNAVQPDSVKAVNHGRSIWKADIKFGANPEETILKYKSELLEIIMSKGFRLRDFEIKEN
jgi:hypothetical protein